MKEAGVAASVAASKVASVAGPRRPGRKIDVLYQETSSVKNDRLLRRGSAGLDDFRKFWRLQRFQRNVIKATNVFPVINPHDEFRKLWDMTTILLVIYLVWLIPFTTAFQYWHAPDVMAGFNVFVDVWFAVDILLNFRTGYVHHGTLVMDPGKIASHYMQGYFFVDLIGTIPFELFISDAKGGKKRKLAKLTKYFKIPKLLRLGRLRRYLELYSHLYRAAMSGLVLVTSIHFLGCIWMLSINPCNFDDALVEDHHYPGAICSDDLVFNLYAEGLHECTVMLFGISNVHVVLDRSILRAYRGSDAHLSETQLLILSMGIILVGFALVAHFVANFNVMIQTGSTATSTFLKTRNRVNAELDYFAVPLMLRERVEAYYDYVWLHQRQYDEKITLLHDPCMSPTLKLDIALHLYRDVVENVTFFKELEDKFLARICMKLVTIIFLPGDYIIFKGDVGKELFIIAKGLVDIIPNKESSQRITLGKGEFLGEIALVMDVRRTSDVVAKTICETYTLHQRVFDEILFEVPEFAQKMKELVMDRHEERRARGDDNDRNTLFSQSHDEIEKQIASHVNAKMRRDSRGFARTGVGSRGDGADGGADSEKAEAAKFGDLKLREATSSNLSNASTAELNGGGAVPTSDDSDGGSGAGSGDDDSPRTRRVQIKATGATGVPRARRGSVTSAAIDTMVETMMHEGEQVVNRGTIRLRALVDEDDEGEPAPLGAAGAAVAAGHGNHGNFALLQHQETQQVATMRKIAKVEIKMDNLFAKLDAKMDMIIKHTMGHL